MRKILLASFLCLITLSCSQPVETNIVSDYNMDEEISLISEDWTMNSSLIVNNDIYGYPVILKHYEFFDILNVSNILIQEY